jgi:hypothetical protein
MTREKDSQCQGGGPVSLDESLVSFEEIVDVGLMDVVGLTEGRGLEGGCPVKGDVQQVPVSFQVFGKVYS